MAIYNQIGNSYNSTRKADPVIVRKVLDQLQPIRGERYLDLACGTGNYTIEYKKSGLQLIGVDPSKLMIDQAQVRDASIDWSIGSAEALPFEDNSFRGVICTNAIHHFQNLSKSFLECSRVISSGRLVIFCSTQEQMEQYWLNHYFPEMMRKSIEQMPTRNQIFECLEGAGFVEIVCEPFSVTSELEDLFLYSQNKGRSFILMIISVRISPRSHPCPTNKNWERDYFS